MSTPSLAELLPALKRLDARLAGATMAAQTLHGAEMGADRFRGLYINQAEVARLLHRQPGEALLYTNSHVDTPSPEADAVDSRLAWLQHTFELTTFDLDVLVLALAPELDRRYERLYAYLQDHVSHRWPTVDLALHLLCPDAAARLERRAHFDPSAPLIRHGLLRLAPESEQTPASLLTHTLKVDEQIVRFVLHQDGLDERLDKFCRLIEPKDTLDDVPVDDELAAALVRLITRGQATQRPVQLYFQGARGSGKRQVAEALAGDFGYTLLQVNVDQALAEPLSFTLSLQLVFRYTRLYRVILYLDGLDCLLRDEHAQDHARLVEQMTGAAGITILAGTQPWSSAQGDRASVVTISFAPPNFDQRRRWWQIHLAANQITLAEPELDTLAGRFRLALGQIASAVMTATAATPTPTLADLCRAARTQSGHELAALARKVEPHAAWADIVLPDDALAQLREICQRLIYRQRVLGEWGFDRKLSLGKGVNALFAGPSGTGKTMSAEIIANELGLDLYKIDLSSIVSKYIGETEKNLDRIFRVAGDANAILFFDEADALFGKRSEVRDSHDRYANIEISYLLQKMEEYDGLAILATNLRQNLDEAFTRRLAFTVHFPFPDEPSRRSIWAGIWPAETPLAADVNLDALSRQFKLAGGNIKNIALAAAYFAAADGGIVTMAHLLHATRREYQKLGKVLSPAELASHAEVTSR